MPCGDRTGPAGYGPLSGRRLGYCVGHRVPGFMNGPVYGRGLAHKRGFGRGYGRGFRAFSHVPAFSYPINYDKENEVEYLKETARVLEDELNQIKGQINKLEENNTD